MKEFCKIKTLDSVWTELDYTAYTVLNSLLSYEYDLWIPGRFGKRKKKSVKRLITKFGKSNYLMLTGFVDKALDFLDEYKIPYEYTSDLAPVEFNDPFIDGITFRPYQLKLIDNALEHGRGVIKSPTGSGKSIIILGIMSAFSKENILFLVHTTDLVYQMKKDLDKFGMPCGVWTGKDKYLDRITVATVQAYKKIARDHCNDWDVIFVDEGHHVTQVDKGNYFNVLSVSAAPCKFAFTATTPTKESYKWALEGLIGPKIGELTMKEGTKLGFLAKPHVKLIGVESPIQIWEKSGRKKSIDYATSYDVGIVNHATRNAHVAAEAELEMERGGTVLILVKRIKHGSILNEMIKHKTEIIRGAVGKEERKEIKEALDSGEIGCVIATVVWAEGVDIPNLSCVINALGGKSEREVLQIAGRGLRKTETKDSVLIVDFMDIGNKHLQNHSESRRDIYEEQGWKTNSC